MLLHITYNMYILPRIDKENQISLKVENNSRFELNFHLEIAFRLLIEQTNTKLDSIEHFNF